MNKVLLNICIVDRVDRHSYGGQQKYTVSDINRPCMPLYSKHIEASSPLNLTDFLALQLTQVCRSPIFVPMAMTELITLPGRKGPRERAVSASVGGYNAVIRGST